MQAEILKLLAEGPATTGEIAAALGVCPHDGVTSILCSLRKRGRVQSRAVPRTGGGKGPNTTSMWELAA